MSETPAERIGRYLDEQGVSHEIVEHEEVFTALAEARASDTAPEDVAKGVLLHTAEGYRLAVIPASEQIDLRKVKEITGEGKIRLATEEEMAVVLPDVELGALPPLGPALPGPEILDERLLEHERVLCSAGDHRHGVRVDPNEIVRLAGATVADVCEE